MRKKLRNFFYRGICLTSVAFVFQACYGTPKDYGMDIYIEGQVKSKQTGLPIEGIKVSVANSSQYTYTNKDGDFSFYTVKYSDTTVLFQDVDSIDNKNYIDKDTLFTSINENIYLNIELEEK